MRYQIKMFNLRQHFQEYGKISKKKFEIQSQVKLMRVSQKIKK